MILITGGTGYLGRSLIRRILAANPRSIRVFSRDEVKHHNLLEQFDHNPKLRSLIGDVRDLPRISRAVEGADIVIHAAALKRLDILEYNVDESIKTNILGSLNVITACRDHNVPKAVFVSTDKACSPVNTYGACKFVGERLFVESNYSRGNKQTLFTCVRYGNVLESTGSVIPFFESKISKGERVPLTDERMTRFLITSDQAVDLIFKSLQWGVGGEIFVPQLPAFKVTDLIGLLAEKHQVDVRTETIGIRPGEKIHEMMVNDAEVGRTFEFEDMYVITSNIEKYHLEQKVPYLDGKKSLKDRGIGSYSSEDHTVARDKARDLFYSFGLLSSDIKS